MKIDALGWAVVALNLAFAAIPPYNWLNVVNLVGAGVLALVLIAVRP